MPVVTPSEAETFELHGSRFRSFASSTRGSSTLCAWQLEVPAGTPGLPHRPDHEEILLLQTGELRVELDDAQHVVRAGDVLVVPAGVRFSVSTTDTGATAWVTTTAGLTATTDDGTVIAPPWAQ